MPTPNLPAGFDFTDPDIYAERLPIAELAEMRKVAPIWWNEQPEGVGPFGDSGYWVVTKHKDVKEVSRRNDVFSSNKQTALPRYRDEAEPGSLEAGKVVDLLPDREAATVAAWLQDHPGIEIVSRDRASAYAEATRRAAPQAVQIADRWHLMRNMSDALRTALEPHHRVLKQAAQGSIQGFIASAPPPLPSSTLSAKQQNRAEAVQPI